MLSSMKVDQPSETPPDRLDALLRHFRLSARLFHAGALCGLHDFPGDGASGQLHLVRAGAVQVRHAGQPPLTVDQPSLLLYPRPCAHRFETDPERGADMACADIAFGDGPDNLLARALPSFVAMPLAALPAAGTLLDTLFEEAFAARCGRALVVDRLFEVVVVMLLRRLLDAGVIGQGAFAGLAHPGLARALVALHAAPQRDWDLPVLASTAGMSRSRFAELFARIVGQTPAAYLAAYRIELACAALQRGRPLALVADEVGYGSAAALSRAFTAKMGASPRAWLRQAQPQL